MKRSWLELSRSQQDALARVPRYHGGPQVKSGKAKIERGLRQQQKLQHGKVIEVMKDGQVLHPKRLSRALPQIQAAAEKLAQQNPSPQRDEALPGRAGMSSIQIPPLVPVAGKAGQGGTVA